MRRAALKFQKTHGRRAHGVRGAAPGLRLNPGLRLRVGLKVGAPLVLLLAAFAAPLLLRPAPVEAQNSGGGTTLELIPSGSYVIPMDNTRQNLGTAPFNLRAYGLVTRLLWAGIPVKWAIAPGKLKDGVDFTATAQRIQPSAVGAASNAFSGGPFIVHRDFAVPALAVINAYAPGASVAVYETTADVTVNVRHTLTHMPKVAVFNDGASADIHTRYLDAAGFTSGTHYDVLGAAGVLGAGTCYTMGSEPHWDATGTAADSQAQAVRNFLVSGGNFLAECAGVDTYENNAAFGRFMTTTGITDGGGDNPTSYPSPDLPYSQFVGAMADVGGSVRDFAPLSGGAWRAGQEMHVQRAGSLRGSNGAAPAKAAAVGLAGSAVGGFVFYLGGHDYNTTALDNINAVRMYLNAVMTPSGRPAGCNLAVITRTISGTVYEDLNGDSLLADGVVKAGVSVRLYRDNNNNGAVDAGETYLAAATTDASGQYSFQVAPQSTGANYLVAVNSKQVLPAAGLIAGRGDAWAEQTYGDNPATPALDLGSRFGGRTPGTSDNFNTAATAAASNNYQHLARVDVSAGNVAGANFGFSFNVVTHTGGGDAADDDTTSAGRTVQGSLRQFIQNADALAGANAMRFVPGVAANAGTHWRVTVAAALPAVIDADTTLDGAAYSSANGTTLLDTNAGSLGAGGTVGVGSLALSQVARPELEVVGSAAVAVGFDLQASSSVVRRFALRGFGTTSNNDNSANVRVGNNFTGALVEQNFLGVAAASATFTTGAATGAGDNIRSAGADSGTVRNNLIGFSNGKGIQLGGGTTGGTSTGWLVENNEVRYNGIGNANLDGIDIENGSGNCTVRGNLFVGNEAPGVDMYESTGGNTIENNTVTGNGIGAGANIESPGVRLYGAANTVSLNVINANFGAGVMVTSNSTSNVITRNSIYANGTITNKGGAGPSGQIGIDLLSAGNNQLTGTSPFVTLNDSGDADSGGNGIANFPVFTSAQVIGANLVLKGYARPGAAIELFAAAADPSGFGEGQTYLLTLTEGSAADTDAATGTYGPGAVGGLLVGTDTTNLFQFTLPLPGGVAVGTILTATATVSSATSEFSGNVMVASPPPDVQLVKACTAPADCTTAPQQPGTELTYTITFSNVGGQPAQNVYIVDIIPYSVDLANSLIVRSTDFKVGSMAFTPDTSTLSLLPAGVKHFSDPVNFPAPTPPWGPTLAYTPAGAAGTFDPAVTYVGWQLTGSMPPGTSASVSFTVRIR